MWYLDSWAVLDGLAFASERPRDSLDASATVFLSVPDLEPVPVGRISTALRAQRAAFQDGFRNEDGVEIGFETLAQVEEVIRRAYLAGGLGGTPEPEGGHPVPPLFREHVITPVEWQGPESGSSYYDSALRHMGMDHSLSGLSRRLSSKSPSSGLFCPRTRLQTFEALHAEGGALLLYPYLRAFGEAAVLELVGTRRAVLHLPEHRDALTSVLVTLRAAGLWDSDAQYRAFVHKWRLDELELDGGAASHLRPHALVHLPAPLRQQAAARHWPFHPQHDNGDPGRTRDWTSHPQTLGDELLMALVIRSYFGKEDSLIAVVPVLFCSLLIVSTASLTVSGRTRVQHADRLRLLGRAFNWLAHELPAVDLPVEVEDYLARFATSRLSRGASRS